MRNYEMLHYYKAALKKRRALIGRHGRKIPNVVWNYFMETLDDIGHVPNASPAAFVDNLAVNHDRWRVSEHGKRMTEAEKRRLDDAGYEVRGGWIFSRGF